MDHLKQELFSQANLLQFLSALPSQVRNELFKGDWSEFACQAVFRALEPQARVYALRGIAGQPLREEAFNWRGNAKVHQEALDSLSGLGIMGRSSSTAASSSSRARSTIVEYRVSEAFSAGLKDALVLSNAKSTPNGEGRGDLGAGEAERAEKLAAERWNEVLNFLVSSSMSTSEDKEESGDNKRPSKRARVSTPSPDVVSLDRNVRDLLQELGFVAEAEEEGGRRITGAGYEFMLKEVYEQVFILVQFFVHKLPVEECASTLRFLFYLSFLKPGQRAEVKSSILSSKALAFFEALGLVHEATASTFQVSSLGVYAIFAPSSQKKLFSMKKTEDSDQPQAITHQSSQRAFGLGGLRIIVETTFKVFCYTTSPMHVRMLELFCEIEARLPNLVVAVITRESVGKAFKKGISDDQLLSFLRQNAHPLTHESRFNIIPDNVMDQIRLWKRELTRVQFTSGRLFLMKNTEAIYDKVIVYPGLKPFIAWKDDVGKKLFLTSTEDGKAPPVFTEALNRARQELTQSSNRLV